MRNRDRAALTLLELLIALAILLMTIGPIYETFSMTSSQVVRLDAIIVGRSLAQSILDQAMHRFEIEDSRFYELTSSPEEITRGIQDGSWKEPFLALAQPRTRVLTPVGVPNPYFDLAAGPPLPASVDAGAEYGFWEGFSYEVRVGFDMVKARGSAPVMIDSDGDGVRDVDLAQLEVEVFFDDPRTRTETRSVAALSTFLVVPDKQPGLKAMSQILGGT